VGRPARVIGRILAVAVLLLLVTNRWGDRALYPDSSGQPVAVYVVSHGYHSGLAIPREALARLGERGAPGTRAGILSRIATRFAAYEWIEIGWGRASTGKCPPSEP